MAESWSVKTQRKATKDYFIGAEVGGYRISDKIGEGAMGIVYRGVHTVLGRPVAIKFLSSELARDQDAVERFFTEARAVNAIRHPNIVDISDFGQRGNRHYFVMELLEGDTLLDRLDEDGRMETKASVRVGVQIASALAAAHDKGIVHRDLKPDNVFICNHPDYPDFVKVFDFGIAKLVQPEKGFGGRTRVGSIIGTPHYMSPEQCLGESSLDSRSDIYSLGVVLYRMVTGVVPFDAKSLSEIIGGHIKDAPIAPRKHNSGISEQLEAVILRAMEKDPDDRYADMRGFRNALEDCVTEKIGVGTPPPDDPTAGRRARGRDSTAPPPMVTADRTTSLVDNLLEIVLSRIESDRLVLPAMPASAMEAIRELDNPNVTFRKIAEIIGGDPVLTPQLYRLASTARFGNAGAPRTMEQAISRLGMATLKTTLIELSAHQVYESRNRKIRKSFKGIWDHTVAVGVASRSVAEVLDCNPFAAHLAGLMHDVGKPIVGSLLLEAEKKLGMKKKDWLTEENWAFVIESAHRQVGSALAKKWDLPDEVIQVLSGELEYSDNEDDMCSNIVRFSNAFAKRCGKACGDYDEEEIEDIVTEGVDRLGLDWVFVHDTLKEQILNAGKKDSAEGAGSTQVLK
ncbi:MAG: HDOD domain-containing protein [Kofleriaceae bacterium]|nr:HDOD domain-containing protein [Kofleriaceae bacterium]